MSPTERRIVDRFKSALQEQLGVSKLVLFGSRARGDAEAFSDMDVLVVIEGDTDDHVRDFVSNCAWEAGFEDGIVVVPIVMSKREWELESFRRSLLGKAVAQEGLAV
jgi:UTP:GlnB (protein PII) uridylyltransferase